MQESLKITPFVIKEIFKSSLSSAFFEEETGVNIDNFTRMFEGVSKLGMSREDFLEGTSRHTQDLFTSKPTSCDSLKQLTEKVFDQIFHTGIHTKPFSNSDRYISNEDNAKIFQNVKKFCTRYYGGQSLYGPSYSPKIFRNIAKEGTVGLDKIKLKFLPYFSGRRVQDTANASVMVSGDMNKYRIVKPFDSKNDVETYIHSEHGILEKTNYRVTAIRGYKTLEEQMWWFLGNCEVALETSQENIISELSEGNFDQTTGDFVFGIYTKPQNISSIEELNLKKKFGTSQNSTPSLHKLRDGNYEEPSLSKKVFSNANFFRKIIEKKAKKYSKEISDRKNLRDAKTDSFFNRSYELINSMENYCSMTAHHQLRGVFLGSLLGRQLGLSDSQIRWLVQGYLIHDSGKMNIPESILQFKGKFEEGQREIMKLHAALGAFTLAFQHKTSILENFEGSLEERLIREYDVTQSLRLAVEHQEKADGTGYPFGLSAEQTSTHGQISQIIDVFDALFFPRVYNGGGRKLYGAGNTVSNIMFVEERESFEQMKLDFFEKNTLPLLAKYNYGTSAVDLNYVGKDMTTLTRMFTGYCIGNNTVFSEGVKVSKELQSHIKNHKGIDWSLDSLLLDSRESLDQSLHNLKEIVEPDTYMLVMHKLANITQKMKGSTQEFMGSLQISNDSLARSMEMGYGGETVLYKQN